ncbi:MAG: EamA family transporter RarD [Pseudolysinimonas sp.]
MSSPADPALEGVSPAVSVPPSRFAAGLAFSLSSYVLWGFLPVYFLLLAPSGAFEIVAYRILFSLAFCALLLTVTRGWGRMWALVHQPRVLGIMAAAGVFIYLNWQIFVLAVTNGRVVEGALGYFINPVFTVLLGVVFLRERLRPAQWVAVGISAIAIVIIAVGYGTFPWIAIGLAFSFGLYGFIKKRVGGQVDAVSGLTLETAWLVPVAVVQLILVAGSSGLTLSQHGPLHVVLIVLVGVATVVPLLLFAAAAARLPLIAIGLTQYLTPVLQFILGVVFLGEAMSTTRWVGFVLVWVALIVLTVDLIRAARAQRRASHALA